MVTIVIVFEKKISVGDLGIGVKILSKGKSKD